MNKIKIRVGSQERPFIIETYDPVTIEIVPEKTKPSWAQMLQGFLNDRVKRKSHSERFESGKRGEKENVAKKQP